jgi:hypothetical protein
LSCAYVMRVIWGDGDSIRGSINSNPRSPFPLPPPACAPDLGHVVNGRLVGRPHVLVVVRRDHRGYMHNHYNTVASGQAWPSLGLGIAAPADRQVNGLLCCCAHAMLSINTHERQIYRPVLLSLRVPHRVGAAAVEPPAVQATPTCLAHAACEPPALPAHARQLGLVHAA